MAVAATGGVTSGVVALAVISLPALLGGCIVALEVDSRSRIGCQSDAECPPKDVCHPELALCIGRDAEPPRQAVTFVLPRDGDRNVSTTVVLLVATALPAPPESLAMHASLVDQLGADWPLEVATSPEATTLLLTPREELTPHATYRLTIAPGVATLDTRLALPTAEETVVTFETGDHRDTMAPGSPTAVVVDRVSPTRADLRWVNPGDKDWAGVLVLRKKGAPLVLDPTAALPDLPFSGVSYAVGDKVGGAEIAGYVAADHVSSLDLDPGSAYDFALFSVDRSTNYSVPVRVPFISDASLLYCPGNSGSFSLAANDAGSAALLLAPCDGASCATAAPFSGPGVMTLDSVALGASGAFSLPTTTPGARFSYRFSVTGGAGVALTVPVELDYSLDSLAPLAQPDGAAHAKIGIGAAAVLSFTPFSWPGFAAAVDTDPAPSSESWTDIAPIVAGPNSRVQTTFSGAGSYRLRVRPVVSGCPDAAWVVSDEFTVGGGARYVSASTGDDALAGYGTSRVTPYRTIQRALADADNTNILDIHVATGSYGGSGGTGLVINKHKVRLYGGYSTDFTQRDPPPLGPAPANDLVAAAFPTTISGSSDSETVTGSAGYKCLAALIVRAVAQVTVDGFEIHAPIGTGGLSNCGLFLERWSGVSIDNNRIYGNLRDSGGGETRAILSRCSNPQSFTGNYLEAHSNYGNSYGLLAHCEDVTTVTATHNRMRAPKALTVDGSPAYNVNNTPRAVTFVGSQNRLEGDVGAWAPSNADVRGFECNSNVSLDFHDNVVQPSLRFDGTDHNNSSAALAMPLLNGTNNMACFGRVENNLFDGGAQIAHTFGVDVWTATPGAEALVIANNVVTGGLGVLDRTAAQVSVNFNVATNVVLAHNTFYLSSHGTVPIDKTVFVNGGGTFAYNGRYINNVFAGRFPTRALLWTGRIEAFQNNLVTVAPSLVVFNDNATLWMSVNDVETNFCAGNPSGYNKWYIRTTSNAQTGASVDALFVSPPTMADTTLDALLTRSFRIAPASAAAFAFGLDSRLTLCGGGAGSPGVCTGNGTSSCGNVTVDRAGQARPTTTPSVGAYEP